MKSQNSTERLRTENRALILRTLRDQGPVARVELSKITHLSPATVTAITRELLADNWLWEQESDERPARGRPRVMIDIHADAAHAIVASVRSERIALYLYNLKGELLQSSTSEAALLTLDANAFETYLIDKISTFMRTHRVTKKSLQGLSLALQGTVERQSGKLYWSPVLSFKDHALQPALTKAFRCPVEVINDANAIALALHSQAQYRDTDNFASVMLGIGVGMGMFINGRMYQGHSGGAAEFGHLQHNAEGPLCRCGQHGCIEAYISDYALIRDCGHLLTAQSLPLEQALEQLLELAEQGRHELLQWLDQAGRVLGTGIAHVINLLAPEQLVISTTSLPYFTFIETSLFSAINKAVNPPMRALTTITIEHPMENLVAQGAARRALSHFYLPSNGAI